MSRRTRPIDPDQQYLSPRQVARVMGVSEYLVYREVADGKVPCRKLGGRILIPRHWVVQSSEQ